jgi:uncharacterized protein
LVNRKSIKDIKMKIDNSKEWHWFKGGILVSLLSVATYIIFEALNYRNYPFGITGGYGYASAKLALLFQLIVDNPIIKRYSEKPDSYIEFLTLIGIVIGSFTASKLTKTFSQESIPAVWEKYHGKSVIKRYLVVAIGSILLGFGAALAGGCTTGNILQGWANFSLGSIVAGMSFFASGIITAKLLYPNSGGKDVGN